MYSVFRRMITFTTAPGPELILLSFAVSLTKWFEGVRIVKLTEAAVFEPYVLRRLEANAIC